MKRFFIFILFLVFYSNSEAQSDTTQKITEERKNSPEQQQKPYVILISADGFRYDYAEKHKATNLLSFSETGVKAESMIPGFPTLTFPNHYSLVTGLYPAHHGLVNNYFYDPLRKESYTYRVAKVVRDGSWYGGVPLWVLAEEQKMLTASFYWVGSEANIRGVFPTYYYAYNEVIPIDRRIDIVKDWLNLPAEKRPHLITFYFPETDHAGHDFGPDDNRTGNAVRKLDSAMLKLTAAVKSTGLPVNFIFVSDHGMISIDTENPLTLPAAVDTNRFIIPRGAEIIELYAKHKKDILPTYKNLKKAESGFTTYLKKDLPQRLHYGLKDDWMNRVGDIVLLPKWPKVFTLSDRKPKPGAHGYDPYQIKEMHAVFMAWGPAFKSGIKVPSFENVNVFPVVTKILGLSFTHKIDGTLKLANDILK